MRIEVCVIEHNPASLNGTDSGAIWTEIFDNEAAADLYVQEVDLQEKNFMTATGINVTYTVLGMIYHNDCNVKRLEIKEYSL